MSDDLTVRHGMDRERINVNERYELDYWSKKFGCSRERLIEIVKEVGDRVERVQERLSRS